MENYNLEIMDFEIEETEEYKQRFEINNLESCNWAFRKLAKIKLKENEVKRVAEKEKERIDTWEKKELAKNEDAKAFFEGLLVEYYSKEKLADPKFKISTPYGKVSSRKQQPSYKYDVNKFINWAKENEYLSLIRVKEEVDKTATKKAFKINGNELLDENTGQIVEGVTIIEGPDSITIKTEA